jgi:hypothetical protein
VQHRVELTVRKRQRLGRAVSEDDLKTGLGRLPACSCKHLRRRVNAVHGACRPDLSLGPDGQAPRPATDVKDSFAGLQVGEAENRLAKGPFAPQREQPDQKIVTRGGVDDEAGRARRWMPICRSGHVVLLLRAFSSEVGTGSLSKKTRQRKRFLEADAGPDLV